MKYYMESEKKIPVIREVDVLVIGGGPLGFAAAYAAAKNGADTLLVEQLGDVGGISTSGLMSHWTGNVNSRLYDLILERSAERNEGAHKGVRTITIDPEKLKTLYLELLQEVSCGLLLYTFASGAIMEGTRLKGAILENKSGRMAVYAKTVIDASGDGDIAAKAGVPYVLGRENDGKMQPATLMFKVGGVHENEAVFLGAFESTYQTERGELQTLAREHLPFPAGHVLLYCSTLPGVVTCNMTNAIDIDGTKTEDLVRATVECRGQMERILQFLRDFVPGYQDCFIISSASLVGIRESRHFKGRYTLTEKDILEARCFDDAVVFDATFNFDVHNIDGAGLDRTGVQKEFKQKKGYTIPYRCLVPEEISGLLLCGRNISGTHIAHSNFRAMPICVGIGEAAGIAAAIAARREIAAGEVAAGDIQEALTGDAI